MSIIQKIKEYKNHKKQEDKAIEALEEIIEKREESGEENLLDSRELPLMKNLFRLRDIRVEDVMVPVVSIDAVSIDTPSRSFYRHLEVNKHTRYPVYDGTLDNIVGFIHVKDILYDLINHNKKSLRDMTIRPILFISPAMRSLDLLKKMQKEHIQMAIVVDEYGGTDGLVVIDNLLEVVMGEMDDEHDIPEIDLITPNGKKSWIAKGEASLYELEELLKIRLSHEDLDVDTVGGYVFALSGKIPKVGEIIKDEEKNLKFKIIKANRRRIQQVEILA